MLTRRRFLKQFSFCLVSTAFGLNGCFSKRGVITPTIQATAQATRTAQLKNDFDLQLIDRRGCFELYGLDQDRSHVLAIANALEARYPLVCVLLEVNYRDTVKVEVYTDQDHFDRNVMNPDLKGFYACSGNHRIQIVSPANPPKHVEITYEERAEIAVHEFVHLVIDAIQPAEPICLDEGTACFVGSYLGYASFCQNHFPFELRPSFQELNEDYYAIPGNDLFSFALVDYFVTIYGWEVFNQLLRRPEALETILGINQSTIEDQWQAFMTSHYANAKETPPSTLMSCMPTARLAHGAASVNGKLLVIGGRVVRGQTVVPLGNIDEYDPRSNHWTEKTPMPTPRSSFGLVVLNDMIYVIGGTPSDTREALDSVEVYDPKQDRWSSLTRMPTPRSQVGVGVIAGKIYAIGGNAGRERAFEMYDPERDSWTQLPDLPLTRRNVEVASVQGRLFVVGGVEPDGLTTVSTVQEYVPQTGEWLSRKNMLLSRTDFALCTHGGKIFALGGFHDRPLSDVEAYNLISNRWEQQEALSTPLQFHAAVVLNGKILISGGTEGLREATNRCLIYLH